VGVGGVIGGAILVKVVKHVSPKTIQFWGFIALTILLIVTGATCLALTSTSSVPIVLYILIQLFFNLGPNATTYLIPAELFPTRYRGTAYGISAGAGRLGAIVAQNIVIFAKINGETLSDGLNMLNTTNATVNNPDTTSNSASYGPNKILGCLMIVFGAFTFLGAVMTRFLIPETRDKAGNTRSLEVLAKGYKHLKEIGREPDADDVESDA
jgi:MFS transporter, PHS family, inorganic phosphate transporter